jgi:DNA-binding transcriptional LysR family regulator
LWRASPYASKASGVSPCGTDRSGFDYRLIADLLAPAPVSRSPAGGTFGFTAPFSFSEAGERLLRSVGPRFEEIDGELEAVTSLGDRPAGTIRLTATENAAASVLWPVLERFLPKCPEIKVEIVIDYGLTDILAQRFDAGVRPGETVASGMISVRDRARYANGRGWCALLRPRRPPPVAQKFEQLRREHHVAVPVPFALLDPQRHALTADVGHLQMGDLGNPEACAVGDAERGFVKGG